MARLDVLGGRVVVVKTDAPVCHGSKMLGGALGARGAEKGGATVRVQ